MFELSSKRGVLNLMMNNCFRTELGKTIFDQKYANYKRQPWWHKASQLAQISHGIVDMDEEVSIFEAINEMKFLPGGRYIYYAGKPAKFYNNCFIFKSKEDTREAWADLMFDITNALMSGGGIGNDYSVFRAAGASLNRTGGTASGPIPLMQMVNEAGRNVMQGGSRRSAMYASLNWQHGDIQQFLHVKDWEEQYLPDGMSIKKAKELDFNYPAPLDMTNISVNYDDAWLKDKMNPIFISNVRQAMKNGEPGFSFNFGDKQEETGRNACTEVTSADDGDVCNLGSINLANVATLEEFRELVRLGTKFLICGTLEGEVPSEKIKHVRGKNRRLGLGIMGVHEWLLQRGYGYDVVPELHEWLEVYRDESDRTARDFCKDLGLSCPIGVRAIAPTGTIGILAGTTTGIEPIYAVAYKRRFLVGGSDWHYQYCIDSTAQSIIEATGVNPNIIETANTLARDPERRIKFQADVQDYVDMAISSTLNLPEWGSEVNCEEQVHSFAKTLSEYAHRLRGITFYPDGSRGGQPITEVPYEEANGRTGVTFEENDSCLGGICGL